MPRHATLIGLANIGKIVDYNLCASRGKTS